MESSKNVFRQAVFYVHRRYERSKWARCYIVHIDIVIDVIYNDVWAKVLGQTESICSHCNRRLTTQYGRVTGRQRWRDKKGRQVNQHWFLSVEWELRDKTDITQTLLDRFLVQVHNDWTGVLWVSQVQHTKSWQEASLSGVMLGWRGEREQGEEGMGYRQMRKGA